MLAHYIYCCHCSVSYHGWKMQINILLGNFCKCWKKHLWFILDVAEITAVHVKKAKRHSQQDFLGYLSVISLGAGLLNIKIMWFASEKELYPVPKIMRKYGSEHKHTKNVIIYCTNTPNVTSLPHKSESQFLAILQDDCILNRRKGHCIRVWVSAFIWQRRAGWGREATGAASRPCSRKEGEWVSWWSVNEISGRVLSLARTVTWWCLMVLD